MPIRSTDYKKLSPKRLRELGLSPKSERYANELGQIISKRRFQELQLAEKHGRRVTLEERVKNFLTGIWNFLTGRQKRAAEGRRAQAARVRREKEDLEVVRFLELAAKAMRGELTVSEGKEFEKLKRKMRERGDNPVVYWTGK